MLPFPYSDEPLRFPPSRPEEREPDHSAAIRFPNATRSKGSRPFPRPAASG